MNYSSIFEINKDITLYTSLFDGTTVSVVNFPQILSNRWQWLVDRYDSTYQKRFKLISSGQKDLLKLKKQFESAVLSAKIGQTDSNILKDTGNILKYYAFLDSILISELALTPYEQQVVNDELIKASRLSIDNFQQMKRFLTNYINALTSTIGRNDQAVDSLLMLPVIARQRAPNDNDYQEMDAIFNLVDFIDGIIFDLRKQSKSNPNLLNAFNNTVTNGVKFKDNYLSAIAVPFQLSLEDMAKRFLGNSNKWFEIVEVNNLQAPYVDNSGLKVKFLSPATLKSVRVTSSIKSKISIGTKIKIGSTYEVEQSRIVEKIIDNKDGTMTLDLSGNAINLKFADSPFLRYYAPMTVNEESMILIPVNIASPQLTSNFNKNGQFGKLDAALAAFGVDFKRDEITGDFVINKQGNFDLVGGVDAIRQAVLYILKTKQGELEYHKEYGVPVTQGSRFSGIREDGLIIAEAVRQALVADGRFAFVAVTKIEVTPISASINLLVSLPGTQNVIPLGFAT